MSDAWTAALLNAGLGMLGSAGRGENTASALAHGGRGALAGLDQVRQAGQAERQHMMQMAQLQQGLQQASLARQKLQADQAAAARKRDAEAAFRSSLDPKFQPLFDVDRATAIKQAFPEGLTPYQQEELRLKRDRLGFDRDKENYDRSSGGDTTTSAMRMRAAKINDAMRLQGLDRPEATALVDSQTSIVTSPVDGRSMLFNKGTRRAEPIGVKRDPIPIVENTTGHTKPISVDDMAAESGVWPTLVDINDRTVGQWVPDVVSGDRARARTSLNMMRQQAISAFSLSNRPPLAEQERVLDMLPKDGFIESPERARNILNEMRNESVNMRNGYAEQVNSERLPVDQERELIFKITELDRFANRLGAEIEQSGMPQPAPNAAPAPDTDLGDDPLGLFQ